MNRVEEIELLGIRELIVLEKILRDLPKSAPQLHTLCIQLFSGAECFSIDEDFLYDTERLQCVELTNCKISWDSQLLTGLTSLNSNKLFDGELFNYSSFASISTNACISPSPSL